MQTKRRTVRVLGAVVAVVLGASTLNVFASETDDRIESAAKRSYVFKTYLKDDHIRVESTDGAVTLTGTVTTDSHRSLAEETVANLPGVKSVDNRLEVKELQPLTKSDDWIAAKVKAALLLHRSVSARNTKVSVKDGVVTLRGIASSQAEKDLATEYARDADGVKNVINEMTVQEAKEPDRTFSDVVDDASITAQVKLALLTHRSTSALNTKVETKGGVVTLTGTARNAAERDLVTKLVSDVSGVKSVDNRMTVGSTAATAE